ncbi:MAG: hypothetical protein P4M09_21070 [Devosia sp.]|nr:hypothetical protein [Devosia sp.]
MGDAARWPRLLGVELRPVPVDRSQLSALCRRREPIDDQLRRAPRRLGKSLQRRRPGGRRVQERRVRTAGHRRRPAEDCRIREVGHREAHADDREKQRRLAGQDVIRMRPDRGRDDERVMVGQDGVDRAGEVGRLRVCRSIGVVEEIQVDVSDPESPEDPDVLLAPRVHSRPG